MTTFLLWLPVGIVLAGVAVLEWKRAKAAPKPQPVTVRKPRIPERIASERGRPIGNPERMVHGGGLRLVRGGRS